ncbi:MAG: transcription termination/antitermination protein NusG [Candidatus Gygaella obscura]|nr:transcription termination/antitermination protein NusG [Candidatus Gygaella obscura]
MKKWYVVHTQTGLEEKVKSRIMRRMEISHLQEGLGEVFIPTEQISEVRGGRKKISQRKFFPGYILIEVDLSEATYLAIKATPGVTGFIGLGKRPSSLPQAEVDNIIKRSRDTENKPSPKVMFQAGEAVRVTEGPFMNFNGVIEDVSSEKGKVKVGVSIFGRSTPVEIEFWQIEKI